MFSDMYQALLYYAKICYIFKTVRILSNVNEQILETAEKYHNLTFLALGADNSINNGGLKLVLATLLRKFYDHHHDLVNRYGISVS
jgi:hypothetical protein